jgi:hypothetical protein
MRVRLAAAVVVVTSLCFGSAPLRAGVLFDQSGVSPADVRSISTAVVADDFELTSAATLRSVQAYLVDSTPNNNGLLDSLEGTLSWALYDGAEVEPNVFEPDDLIATGSVSGANLVLTDTGVNDSAGGDIIRAHFNITPNQPLFGSNVYWLALHEGEWLSEGDATPVGWVRSIGSFATPSVRDLNEALPGEQWQTNGYDLAFALFDTAVPEPTLLSLAGPALPLALRRRRAHRRRL